MTVSLYPHQLKLINEALDVATLQGSVCLWLPTGGGKTELAVEMARREATNGGHTLFIVDRKTLASQAVERFARYSMLVGLIRGEDTFIRSYEPVTVASIQTLKSRMDHESIRELLARTTLIIIDEAHVLHKSHSDVIRATSARVVGLSATPLRDGMQEVYHQLVRGPGYSWMLETGHLVPPRYFVPVTSGVLDLKGVSVASSGDFDTAQLSRLMSEKRLLGDMVTTYREKGQNRKTIVFCVDIPHAGAVAEAFCAEGYRAAVITCHTPDGERNEILQDFRNGRYTLLVSVVALSVGFDEPSVSCVVLARPTLSTTLHIQQIGRGLRLHPGKKDCLVFDHALNLFRHGKIEDFNPPELSSLTKDTDCRKRSDRVLEDRPCSDCGYLIAPGIRECPECGHAIRKRHNVDHLEAELVEGRDQLANERDINPATISRTYMLKFAHGNRANRYSKT